MFYFSFVGLGLVTRTFSVLIYHAHPSFLFLLLFIFFHIEFEWAEYFASKIFQKDFHNFSFRNNTSKLPRHCLGKTTKYSMAASNTQSLSTYNLSVTAVCTTSKQMTSQEDNSDRLCRTVTLFVLWLGCSKMTYTHICGENLFHNYIFSWLKRKYPQNMKHLFSYYLLH